METITLESDITVLCLDASSFPEGVMAAHKQLHSRVPAARERSYFGVSRPERGAICYKAAAELLPAETPEQYALEPLVLKSGRYTSVFVPDFMKDVSVIGRSFQQLLQHPELDPQGWCVEWYGADQQNVTLMVRLKDGSDLSFGKNRTA